MNLRPYVFFYNGQRWECHAESTFEARQKAASHLKVTLRRQHLISVMLADVDHSGAEL